MNRMLTWVTTLAMAGAVGLGAAQAQEKQQEEASQEADKQTNKPVVVSSKIDTEGAVLGELILQALKNGGVKVENRLQLGATNIMREAITAGEIDIYPEYTGNGAFFFDMTDSDVWKDADAAFEKVKELDREKNNIVWLTPAEANNTWAISVRGDLAEEHDLETLEDLSRYLEQGGDFKLAASAEFVESPVALPAFQKAYGFELGSDQLVVLSGGNTAATLRAAAQGTNGVNAAMAYGTDGGLKALDLRVLEDTKQVQPVYQPAPIVREGVLESQPKIVTYLKPVFEALDLETLQRLNSEVAVNGADPGKVVAEFLTSLDEKGDDPAKDKDSNKDE